MVGLPLRAKSSPKRQNTLLLATTGSLKLLTHFVACFVEGFFLTVLHGWVVGIDGNLLLFDYLIGCIGLAHVTRAAAGGGEAGGMEGDGGMVSCKPAS